PAFPPPPDTPICRTPGKLRADSGTRRFVLRWRFELDCPVPRRGVSPEVSGGSANFIGPDVPAEPVEHPWCVGGTRRTSGTGEGSPAAGSFSGPGVGPISGDVSKSL